MLDGIAAADGGRQGEVIRGGAVGDGLRDGVGDGEVEMERVVAFWGREFATG
jgi:hypothetical protein